jgi:hypothetical protein
MKLGTSLKVADATDARARLEDIFPGSAAPADSKSALDFAANPKPGEKNLCRVTTRH